MASRGPLKIGEKAPTDGGRPPSTAKELTVTLAAEPGDRGVAATPAPATGRPNGPASSDIPTTIGRHLILGRLGEGGMGVVYAAYDPELDRRLAIR